ncbi:MAG: hypothetical protein K0S61_2637, partial [Anaerocolumna sp.]|nr:hypothetical protein [Anaerocolumna sp.]
MDQDFHYYGTYYAAKKAGFNREEASLIAKTANFIDFFNETTYAAYWKLVSDTKKVEKYNIVANLDYPRYTFQGGIFSTLLDPEDGLWCSYHFVPGNYTYPYNTPSCEEVHGSEVASFLSKFQLRDVTQGINEIKKYYPSQLKDFNFGKLLTRPQSGLSRQIIMDAISCATDDSKLEAILSYAIGGQYILKNNREDNLRRFKLILLGVRAHVIADTWAHQDFCGINNVMNTYWDVNYNPNSSWIHPSEWGFGRQSIDYNDRTTTDWRNKVLSSSEKFRNPNFEAVPNSTTYLGHGWMGHLPDFSFIQYRYKPCWADPSNSAIERNNAEEYKQAWLELVSLFTQARNCGQLKLDEQFQNDFKKAIAAITNPCNLADNSNTGRRASASAWQNIFGDLPLTNIDVNSEPDPHAVLDGMLEMTTSPTRYGTDYVNITSDLYLFQIAADYHFHFVKKYLQCHDIYQYQGSWSQQTSALSQDITNIINFYVPNSNNKVLFGTKYRIKSVGNGTVLDDWGGKTGEDSAALQPDTSATSLNRTWILIPNSKGFRIKSVGHGTVLDDWGGKTGENSAALQPDNSPD